MFCSLVAVDAADYVYTIGIDREDEYLYCLSPNRIWRRKNTIGIYPNPLDIFKLGFLLKYTNSHLMECGDAAANGSILSIGLVIQGRFSIY